MRLAASAKRSAYKLLSVLREPALVEILLPRAQRTTSAGRGHILIAPPGGGNIGDQAMVEAFIEGVDGPVTVIVRNEDSFVGLDSSANVSVVVLPDLLYGRFPANLIAMRALNVLVSQSTSLSVVGADIMDGAYDWPSAVTRANIARRAARAGLSSRVLGFSWNAAPHRRALKAVTRAGAAGARLLVRDPQSEARLRSSLVEGVSSVADIVFTSRTISDDPLADAVLSGTKRPLVLLNASGLVARSVDQTGPYADVVEYLVEHGYVVGLVPHVIRSGGDDLAESKKVFDRLSESSRSSTLLIDELLRPAQVRSLTTRASFVITGRMHLAVIALSRGVPAAVVATQGKVDGLMEVFDSRDLVVEPDKIASGAIMTAAWALHHELTARARSVSAKLPIVQEKATRNLEGLL